VLGKRLRPPKDSFVLPVGISIDSNASDPKILGLAKQLISTLLAISTTTVRTVDEDEDEDVLGLKVVEVIETSVSVSISISAIDNSNIPGRLAGIVHAKPGTMVLVDESPFVRVSSLEPPEEPNLTATLEYIPLKIQAYLAL